MASCLLAIFIVHATVFDEREATDSSLPIQAMVPVSIDTDTNLSSFLGEAKVPDQRVKTADDISAKHSNLVSIQNHDTPLSTIERTVDIGEDLDADDPDLNFADSDTVVNIGPDLDVYDTGAEVRYEPAEYDNIGPDIDVADMYRSADYKSEYPQGIGPDMDADDFYQD